MFRQKRFVPILAIALLVLIIAPVLFTGFSDIRRAEAAGRAGDFPEAVRSYLHAIKVFPWRDDLWEKAGLAAHENGKYDEAVSYLLRSPKLSEQGWVALGSSYLNSGNTSLALDAYRRGLQTYDSASLYSGLASVYRSQKNWQAEKDALMNQIRLDQENVYAHYRAGLLMTILEPEQALPELMLASSLDPETDSAVQTLRAALNLSATQAAPAEKMLSIGRALGLVQEWDLAVAAFEKAVRQDPQNAEAWAWLGEAKQQTGQDGSAELDRAVLLQDSSVIVHALRGLYWNRQMQYSKMLAEYQRAAELEPDNPAWQAEMGNAYSRMNDLASAFSAYQRATVLAPDDSTYWRLLAVFCAENGIYLEETGLPAAQKALELSPNDPFVQDALGWTYLSSGRYANAEQVLKNTVTHFPDHLSARIHLAMTYLAQGDRSAAYVELTYVQQADPEGVNGQLAGKLLEQYFP